jgi:hypothetical protein
MAETVGGRPAATPEEAQQIRDDYAAVLRAREPGVRAGQTFAFDKVIDPAEICDRVIVMLRLSGRPARGLKRG